VRWAALPAARGALVLATMPRSTLLLSGLAGRERVDATRIPGVVLGFAGVAVALGIAIVKQRGSASVAADARR
jgi:drug/metabolite transporter (DMT)-like permease